MSPHIVHILHETAKGVTLLFTENYFEKILLKNLTVAVIKRLKIVRNM